MVEACLVQPATLGDDRWRTGRAALVCNHATHPRARARAALPQALDVVLKHRVSYNKDCLAVGRGFFFHDQNVRTGGWLGKGSVMLPTPANNERSGGRGREEEVLRVLAPRPIPTPHLSAGALHWWRRRGVAGLPAVAAPLPGVTVGVPLLGGMLAFSAMHNGWDTSHTSAAGLLCTTCHPSPPSPHQAPTPSPQTGLALNVDMAATAMLEPMELVEYM